MKNLLAAVIWGVVASTMICKTSGNLWDNRYMAPQSN